ncbi:MAG: permease [Sphaerochaeta sp.]
MLNEQLRIAFGEFVHVGWALVVIIAGISVLTGFVREYIPQEKFQKKLKNQNRLMGSITGAALGILTPFCSASMVPVAMGMIEMSAPFSTVLPFIISAPLCNFVVVGIILATFGWKVAIIYFAWTFCGAIVAGQTIGRSRIRHQVKNFAEINAAKKASKSKGCGSSKKKSKSCCSAATEPQQCCSDTTEVEVDSCATQTSSCCAPKETSCCSSSQSGSKDHKQKARAAFQFALALFKQIIPYAILGAAISGIALAFIPSTVVERYVGNGSFFAIPIAAVIGVPLYLRIEMAIPLLNTLLLKGMSMGAAVALLIGGTGASLPELAILSSILKPKGVLAFTLTVVVLAMTGGLLFMFI